MSDTYQWDFGSAESGLQFTVVFDGSKFTVTVLTGAMDLNALWLSDGDASKDGSTTLLKSDSSLNMNGTGVTWDDYYKVSSTGLGAQGTSKSSYLVAGESYEIPYTTGDVNLGTFNVDPSTWVVGIRATSSTSLTGDGKFVDTTAKLIVTNQPPVLESLDAVTVTDTADNDSFGEITGTLSASDPNGNTLTYAVAGSSATVEAGFDQEVVTQYGTFYLSSVTGAYKFVVDDAAVEALKDSLDISFSMHANDGSLDSNTEALTITLAGVNDRPDLDAVATDGMVTDTAIDDVFSEVTGTLAGSDRDGDTVTFDMVNAVASNVDDYDRAAFSDFGTLYLNSASGAYKFVADDAAVEALKTTESIAFDVFATDGTATSAHQSLAFTLLGANDTPELAPVDAATVQDTTADDVFADVVGQLAATDRDAGDTPTFELAGSTASSALPNYDLEKVTNFGTFYLSSTTGEYRFVVNDGAVETLASADLVSFVVNSTDGEADSATQQIDINLAGVNDAVRDIKLTISAIKDNVSGVNTSVATVQAVAGTDPDGGGTYSYSLSSAQSFGLNGVSLDADVTDQFSLNTGTGLLSTSSLGGLADGTVYELAITASQGAGATLASYTEVFNIVRGTSAAETMPGSFDYKSGDDVIYGRQNNDIIFAGSGDDVIFGGAGIDTLYGEAGNDVFAFASLGETHSVSGGGPSATLTGVDVIADFAGNGSGAGDVIALSQGAGGFWGGSFNFTNTTTATVTAVTVGSASTYEALIAALGSGTASTSTVAQVYDVTVTAGTFAGHYAVINNATAALSSADDAIIKIGTSDALHANDFFFG